MNGPVCGSKNGEFLLTAEEKQASKGYLYLSATKHLKSCKILRNVKKIIKRQTQM